MEDARVYSEHAQKKELDVSDVKLAVQTRMDHSFTTPPPRDVSIAATSEEKLMSVLNLRIPLSAAIFGACTRGMVIVLCVCLLLH